MLKLISPNGGETWVDEKRLDEYEARGFKLAPPPPIEPKKPAVKKPAPKKKATPKKEA